MPDCITRSENWGSRPVHLIDFYHFGDNQSYANFSDNKKEDHFDVGESTAHIDRDTYEDGTVYPLTDCLITRSTFDKRKKPFLVNRIQTHLHIKTFMFKTVTPGPITLKDFFQIQISVSLLSLQVTYLK